MISKAEIKVRLGKTGRGWGVREGTGGREEEMTQTLCTHMNKIKIKKKENVKVKIFRRFYEPTETLCDH
jgi:hypothetical protein